MTLLRPLVSCERRAGGRFKMWRSPRAARPLRYRGTVLAFEWDEAKNAANSAKYAISIEEAVDVFRRAQHNRPRSGSFDRWGRLATIGVTVRRTVVVVIHTDIDDVIRLISARMATPKEGRGYESV